MVADWWIDGLIDACTRLHHMNSYGGLIARWQNSQLQEIFAKNERRIHPASSRVRCQGRKPPQPLQMSSDHILTRHLPQVASDRKPFFIIFWCDFREVATFRHLFFRHQIAPVISGVTSGYTLVNSPKKTSRVCLNGYFKLSQVIGSPTVLL